MEHALIMTCIASASPIVLLKIIFTCFPAFDNDYHKNMHNQLSVWDAEDILAIHAEGGDGQVAIAGWKEG